MATGGRRPFVPSAEQRRLVAQYAAMGATQDQIRQLILKPDDGKPVSLGLLEREFREELDTATIKANATVAGALYKKALAGNVTAMIFWLKTRAGWRETNRVELTGANGGPVQSMPGPDLSKLTPEELEQWESLLLKSSAPDSSA